MPPTSRAQRLSDTDIALRRLSNTINLMTGGLGDYNHAYIFSSMSAKIGHRARAIRWMKQMALEFGVSSEGRDSSVQIFDKFLSSRAAMDMNPQLDLNFVSYSAAASLSLGSKIHDGKRGLSLTGFKDFDFELLKNYERWILNTIAFSISPQVAPTIFVQEFLQFCSSNVDKTEITKISDSLISKFLEEPTSTLFAPSIIAISSLILSFSILKVDCSDWLSNMPNFCLLHSEIPNSAENVDSRYFDIDSCLQNFRNVEEDYPHYRDGTETPSRSPTRVVDGIDSPALSSSQNQIQNQKDRNTLKRKRSSYNLQEIFIDDAFLPLPTSDSYSNSTTNKRTFGVFSPLVLSQDVPVKFTTSLSVMMMNRGDTIVSEKSPFPGNDS